MDGENTSMYSNGIHARSLDGRNHSSRNWVKGFWSTFAQDIPSEMRICGENMFAKHSIAYSALESYFYGFSIWNEDTCLSWDDTIEWLTLLNIKTVPVLYDGIFNVKKIQSLWKNDMCDTSEGYVIRIADSFNMKTFKLSVGKFVRKNHVQTTQHWMHGREIIQNEIK